MKINNLKINAYGNIENKEIELKSGINIIQGRNESGKSTLLNYIISSFYGISKNKDGRALSDYEKYKPWNSSEFSGRIQYELDDGKKFEIFRDFNKKNPKIYNEKLEDITNQFEVDKRDGSKFFTEQIGVDKQMYLSTVVSMQEEVRLAEKDQNILIQKIANLAGTGEDNVSYKKALSKLQDKIRDEIGTSKTSQKPINILEKEIREIEDKIKNIEPYRDRKYEIDTEKEEITAEIKELELKKSVLEELQDSIKNENIQNKEIEIKEKNKKENSTKIFELKKQEEELNKNDSNLKQATENIERELENYQEQQKDIDRQIAEINNKKTDSKDAKGKNKKAIFLIAVGVLALMGIVATAILKKYTFMGIFIALTLIDTYIYVNNIKKLSKHKTKENNIKIGKLEEEKLNLSKIIEEKEEELKKYNESKQEINSKMSMLKGQIILLDKNNEQINEELKNIQDNIKEKQYNKKENVINKYKDKLKNIEDLVKVEDYRTKQNEVEEKINNDKVKIKGLEIESNTIIPQLDELVSLEEKLEADTEKLRELQKQEETINIAIENLTMAYEEMKNTITPKFTKSLSSSINKISNSKYEKVTINDENGMVVENNRGEYVEAYKLSTGTIDQLYLALRLSMIDDLSKEKLPIILDESFAYFDNERLENVLRYLKEELQEHQTLIFTCTNREKEILDTIKAEYNFIKL